MREGPGSLMRRQLPRTSAWRPCRTVAAAVLSVLLAGAAQAQHAAAPWAITGATLIDGRQAPAVPDAVIVGIGERLVCAGPAPACPVPAQATILDAAGKWVIPGLIDTHMHLNWTTETDARRAQRLRLAFGNTTVREAWTPGQFEEHLLRRPRADAAATPEPRLLVSGLVREEDAEPDEDVTVADSVRMLLARGADAIKTKTAFTDQELVDIVQTAHANGAPVFGHTWEPGHSWLEPALRAGVDGLSHLTTFSEFGDRRDPSRPAPPEGIERWVWAAEQWHYQDRARLMTAIDLVARRGTWVEPFLVVEKHVTLPYALPADVAYLHGRPSLRETGRPWVPYGDWGWPAVNGRRTRIGAVYAQVCGVIRELHQRGGIIVTGTDGLEPGPALLDEVRLLTGCGLSPLDALRAATQQAAQAVGRPDLGTVEAGKMADLVILDADPLADPAHLRRVWRVVKGGHVHDPALVLRPMAQRYQQELRQAWGVGLLVVGVLSTLSSSACTRRHGTRP